MSGPLWPSTSPMVQEPAGEEEGLGGTDGGGADVAVQDRLFKVLILTTS